MKYVYVDNGSDEYPSCPLRSDLNSCGAVPFSEINSCSPSMNEDYSEYILPDWCPLREGGVCVQFQKTTEID